MSSDNGIYILQTKDGYRVTHAQAIDNLYWWGKEMNEAELSEKRNEINPKELIKYFGKCKLFKTEIDALKKATKLYKEILTDPNCIIEYGISFIHGWEKKEFPKE